MRLATFAAATCLLMGSAAAQDKATMQALNNAFAAAFNAADFAALANMYTEDARLLPPGVEMAGGRAAIQSFWTKASESVADLKLTTVDVKPLGLEAASEIGTFSLKTKAQPAQEVSGKYVIIWQRVGSDWKLATDIWNSNQ